MFRKFFLLLILSLLTIAGAVIGQDYASLSGMVRDEADSTFIHARIFAIKTGWLPHMRQTRADSSGLYVFENLPPGHYVIRAEANGYVSEYYDNVQHMEQAKVLTLAAGDSVTGIDFYLKQTSAIYGLVVTESDSMAIAGAVVSVTHVQGERKEKHQINVRTDENGEFKLSVQPGQYILQIAARGFVTEWFDNVREKKDALPVKVVEGQRNEVVIALASPGVVSGTVTDAGTLQPLDSVHVKAFCENRHTRRHFQVLTDSTGAFCFKGLPAGDYYFVAQAHDYLDEFYEEADSLSQATLVTIVEGKNYSDINFTLSSGACISGAVTDASTGNLLAHAIVTIFKQDGSFIKSARTDSNGQYIFSGLSVGTYLATASLRGHAQQWYLNAAVKDQATPINLAESEIASAIDFTLTPVAKTGGGIRGLVTDDSTGLAIEGAMVFVMPMHLGRPHKAVTGSDGTYELLGLKPGRYIAACRAEGCIAEFYNDTGKWFDATAIVIENDQVVENINFGLVPQPQGLYTISGTVTDVNGQCTEGALVTAEEDGSVIAAGVSETDGSFQLCGIPSGTYQISASCVGFAEEAAASRENIIVGSGNDLYQTSLILGTQTKAVDQSAAPLFSYALEQNYPNPFNPSTLIRFSLASQSDVHLVIYTILGTKVKSLFRGELPAGSYSLTWDGCDDQGNRMASGIYLYRMEARRNNQLFEQKRRMVMLK